MLELHKLLFGLLFLCFVIPVQSQCDVDTVALNSQSQLEDFATQYANCSTLTGRIELGVGVTSLAPLSFLEELNGDLYIKQPRDLQDLSGLSNIKYIHGNLEVRGIDFQDFQFINQLEILGGDLQVNSCNQVNFAGLEKLNEIGGKLIIGTSSVNSTTGLDNVRRIGGIRFSAVTTTVPFNGLTALDSIKGELFLSASPSIINLNGFQQLKYIEGMFYASLENLESITALSNLEYIGGDLHLTRSNFLENLLGLDKLKHLPRAIISYNTRLNGCNVQSLCNFIEDGTAVISVSQNGMLDGPCRSQSRLATACFSTVDGFDFNSQQDLDDFGVQHAQLNKIIGTVNISGDDITDLSALSNIDSICGHFRIQRNSQLETLAGLENLTSVGRSLTMTTNDTLENINALSNLNEVGRSVIIQDHSMLSTLDGLVGLNKINRELLLEETSISNLNGLRNITSIAGNFFMENLNQLKSVNGLEELDKIEGDVLVTRCSQLEDLSALNPSLISGKLRIERLDSLKQINGFNRLKTIGNNIDIQRNPSLEVIAGFNEVDTLHQRLFISDNTKLTTINGFSQLKTLEQFTIRRAPVLGQINAFSQIHSIPGRIEISNTNLNEFPIFEQIDSCGFVEFINNDQMLHLPDFPNLEAVINLTVDENDLLEDVSGFESLRRINNRLLLQHGQNLQSISALENLERITNRVQINDNPKLSNCNLQIICEVINRPQNPTFPDYFFRNNQSGCNHHREIDCSYFGFSGRTFFDTNQNKKRDSLEVYIPGVKISNNTTNEVLFTNNNGKWYYPVDDMGVYNFSLDLNQEFILSSDSASYTRTFISGDTANLDLDFGVYPKSPEHTAQLYLHSKLPRCNTIVPFTVRVTNTGAFVDSFLVKVNYNQFIQLDSTSTTLILQDTINRMLSWQTPSMQPYENKLYTFWMQIADETNIGQNIIWEAEASYSFQGAPPMVVDKKVYGRELRCSYDPNDKLVSPIPRPLDSLSLKDETLFYTVRFQNTGNLEAIQVIITDTLDQNLDWNTFEILEASHRHFTTLNEDGVITFNFDNIFLPDSTSDPEGSQGFITYQIQPLPGLDDYTPIRNTAYIFFDGNSPIITNTTYNILVDKFPITSTRQEHLTHLHIFPNPVKGQLQIDTKIPIEAIQIYTVNGINVKSWKGNLRTLNVGDLEKGMYILALRQEGRYRYVRFVKM